MAELVKLAERCDITAKALRSCTELISKEPGGFEWMEQVAVQLRRLVKLDETASISDCGCNLCDLWRELSKPGASDG